MFHLSPTGSEIASIEEKADATIPFSLLRAMAMAGGTDTPSKSTLEAKQSYLHRAASIRQYARARADGVCEACARDAPFRTQAGVPFLEVHHMRRMTDGEPDRIEAVSAICPNCHREAHFGIQADD